LYFVVSWPFLKGLAPLLSSSVEWPSICSYLCLDGQCDTYCNIIEIKKKKKGNEKINKEVVTLKCLPNYISSILY
jgi:hypothetical protein